MPTYEKQLRGQDTISGQEGKAYITDPDTGEVLKAGRNAAKPMVMTSGYGAASDSRFGNK